MNNVAINIRVGFPGGSVSKESACNAGDLGLIPRLGGSPEGGNDNLPGAGKNRWDMQKATSEMGDLNLNVSIMTLNVNRLNSSHKRHRLSV